MAIQAQLYNTENIGFPLGGGDLMENGCGVGLFNQFYQQQQQQQYNPQMMIQQQHLQNLYQKNNQNFIPRYNNTSCAETLMPASNSLLTDHLEKQNIELDRFITLQNERLRLTLQEQRKKQTVLMLRKYKAKIEYLMKQKDEEIANAANRTVELEEFLKRMEIENQTWQIMAKEKEAMVMSLNNTIEQLRESNCLSSNNNREDAESCCDEAEEKEDKTEEHHHDGHQMMCKSCNCRSSCMIFLPCRHLCSCKSCDSFLNTCPVCKMVKKASIEALI